MLLRNLFALILLHSILLLCCQALHAADDLELEKEDPITIKRTGSPCKTLFVREEIQDNRILRLSIISKSLKSEILKFDSDPAGSTGKTIQKWEWRDLTGSGKGELLIWHSVFFGKGGSAHLDVYYVDPDERYLSKVASIMYSRHAHHVYPDQPPLSGDLTFEKGIIDWTAKPDNRAKPDEVQWVWDANQKTFIGHKTKEDKK